MAISTMEEHGTLHRVLWFALLALLAFAFQGTRPIWEPDEGRYTNIAIQMLESGDWWLPRLHEEQLHLAKPPLTYWVLASSLKVFGRNEWAARLPYGAALLLTALLVSQIASALSYRHARAAAFIWISSLGPFVAFNVVTTDAWLTLFETAAVAAFARCGVLNGNWPRPGWIRLMWLAFAAAFMTKGPPGLLPLLPILVWSARYARAGSVRKVADPLGIAAFVLVGFGWYVSIVARDPRLLHYFLGFEFIDRVFTGVHERNAAWLGAFKVYVPTLLLGSLPWLLFGWGRGSASCTVQDGSRTTVHESRAIRAFLWMWFAIPLVIFALARSRLPLYVLPLFVPGCLLIARHLEAAGLLAIRPALMIACIWTTAALGVRAGIAHLKTDRDARALAIQIGDWTRLGSFDELAFVDSRATYGLRFYARLPIEQIELTPGSMRSRPLLQPESVCDEAAAGGHPLWLVPRAAAAQFETALRDCNFVAWPLPGSLRRWQGFQVSGAEVHVTQVAAAASGG